MRNLPTIILILALVAVGVSAAPRYPQESFFWECELVRIMHEIAEHDPQTFEWNGEVVSKEVFLLTIISQWEAALKREAGPVWEEPESTESDNE